jgi:hypothetical protein
VPGTLSGGVVEGAGGGGELGGRGLDLGGGAPVGDVAAQALEFATQIAALRGARQEQGLLELGLGGVEVTGRRALELAGRLGGQVLEEPALEGSAILGLAGDALGVGRDRDRAPGWAAEAMEAPGRKRAPALGGDLRCATPQGVAIGLDLTEHDQDRDGGGHGAEPGEVERPAPAPARPGVGIVVVVGRGPAARRGDRRRDRSGARRAARGCGGPSRVGDRRSQGGQVGSGRRRWQRGLVVLVIRRPRRRRRGGLAATGFDRADEGLAGDRLRLGRWRPRRRGPVRAVRGVGHGSAT